jgi:hypothetical protein
MDMEIFIGSFVRKAIRPQSWFYRHLQYLYRYLLSIKRGKKLKMLNFDIILTDHCNLNCAGCGAYSPLAKEAFYDKNVFKNDCGRIAQLTSGKINYIMFSGGEPMLHPQITDFFDIARSCFDKSAGGGGDIGILSNGILLNKQPESFWKNCRKNDIEIKITKYPINLDFEAMEKTANKYGVKFSYFQDTDKNVKWTNILPVDINGKQNAKDSFRLCFEANNCIKLNYGRLYTCVRPFTISHFNYYFKTNLQESEADSIDIYKANDIDEILDFLRKPIPFCRYCNWRGLVVHTPWHTSRKEISEWTV